MVTTGVGECSLSLPPISLASLWTRALSLGRQVPLPARPCVPWACSVFGCLLALCKLHMQVNLILSIPQSWDQLFLQGVHG